jgi:D-alanyl-D-alanine carboxypeptidase
MTQAIDTDLAQSIDALFTPHFRSDTPGAALIVTRNGRPLYRRGYGMANLEYAIPVMPETVFRIGSITKQFTAVAILLLAQEGKLTLDSEISTLLPDYPPHDPPITVAHLLTHTSGIPSYTGMNEWLLRRPLDVTLDELIALFKDKPLEFTPGTRFVYNNSGYVLLGAIIERLAGIPYAQFLEQRLFQPLGMTRTSYDDSRRIVPGRAAGYEHDGSTWRNCAYLSMTHPHAAGALASTVDDLARWDAALVAGEVLPVELLDQAWTSYKPTSGEPAHYGYGWALSAYAGHPTVEHGGGINGFISHALRLPEERLFVAVLTNTTANAPTAELLAVQVTGLLLGEPYRAPEAVAIPVEELARYVGAYRGDDGKLWPVQLEDGQLTLQIPSGPKEHLHPLAAHEFFLNRELLRAYFLPADGDDSVMATLELSVRGSPIVRATRDESSDTR